MVNLNKYPTDLGTEAEGLLCMHRKSTFLTRIVPPPPPVPAFHCGWLAYWSYLLVLWVVLNTPLDFQRDCCRRLYIKLWIHNHQNGHSRREEGGEGTKEAEGGLERGAWAGKTGQEEGGTMAISLEGIMRRPGVFGLPDGVFCHFRCSP